MAPSSTLVRSLIPINLGSCSAAGLSFRPGGGGGWANCVNRGSAGRLTE